MRSDLDGEELGVAQGQPHAHASARQAAEISTLTPAGRVPHGVAGESHGVVTRVPVQPLSRGIE
jgi:hypothetical protein